MTDTDGKPVPGARMEVWEADEDGFYDVQYDDDRTTARGLRSQMVRGNRVRPTSVSQATAYQTFSRNISSPRLVVGALPRKTDSGVRFARRWCAGVVG